MERNGQAGPPELLKSCSWAAAHPSQAPTDPHPFALATRAGRWDLSICPCQETSVSPLSPEHRSSQLVFLPCKGGWLRAPPMLWSRMAVGDCGRCTHPRYQPPPPPVNWVVKWSLVVFHQHTACVRWYKTCQIASLKIYLIRRESWFYLNYGYTETKVPRSYSESQALLADLRLLINVLSPVWNCLVVGVP